MKRIDIFVVFRLTSQIIQERAFEFLRLSIPLVLMIIVIIIFKQVAHSFNYPFLHYLPVAIIPLTLMIAIAMTVVGWNKVFLIKDENLRNTPVFRMTFREWGFVVSYFKIMLGLFFIAMFTGMVLELLISNETLFYSIVIMLIWYLFVRVSLVLPMLSVEDKKVSLIQSWKLTEKHDVRLSVLLAIFPILLTIIFAILPESESNAFNFSKFLSWVFVLFFFFCFLSMSYAWIKGYVDIDSTVD